MKSKDYLNHPRVNKDDSLNIPNEVAGNLLSHREKGEFNKNMDITTNIAPPQTQTDCHSDKLNEPTKGFIKYRV